MALAVQLLYEKGVRRNHRERTAGFAVWPDTGWCRVPAHGKNGFFAEYWETQFGQSTVEQAYGRVARD